MIDTLVTAVGGRMLLYVAAALLIACIALTVMLDITNTRLNAAKANTVVLSIRLADQNQAVKKWKAEAVKQELAVQKAAKQREKIRTVTVEKVREVEKAVIPQDCTEAVKWGSEQALMFNTEWEQP